ncbi:DUF421 domain-containing protein [Paenibacillus sp. CMAA1739]|uniref:YetF domain-containing protein n=1 Tax=Paenibacillus ottowii TaxID=2315729 RepID=UPI0027307496|nr:MULTISPECIES: DUF421 domain-containing protein [Paenibacillus]MDP1512718.1 DUF421 domain-containing protein [Paenibacillus ottowii]MEC4568804.1 DUF421 domain-containing protein [Paenibacillus sp. CMAA1739]
MEVFVTIGAKLIISFFGLWIITFITGRKTLSQLTPLDFLTSLVLSEIVGNTLYDDEVTIWQLLFALALWCALAYFFEKATTHFVKFGYMAEGRTVLLVDRGQVNQEMLEKYDIEFTQLLSMLRQQNIFSLREVWYATLETNGSLSVMRKPEYEPPAAQDMGIEAQPDLFSVTVIDKGKLLDESMRGKTIDVELIKAKAREQGYDSIDEIAYAELSEDGTLHVVPMKENTHQKRGGAI